LSSTSEHCLPFGGLKSGNGHSRSPHRAPRRLMWGEGEIHHSLVQPLDGATIEDLTMEKRSI
jgi:hypothetical protein